MSVRPEVQEELRDLFRQGATPSRLVQHIASRHRGEKLHGLILGYFWETFGAPVRGLDPTDDFESVGERYWHLNDDVLREMIQARPMWDSDPREPSWLDPLAVTGLVDQVREYERFAPPELAYHWDQLDDAERRFVQRILANSHTQHDQVRILARLAERLQQRINELEAAAARPRELVS